MPTYKVNWDSIAGKGRKEIYAPTKAKAISEVKSKLGMKHLKAAKVKNFKAVEI